MAEAHVLERVVTAHPLVAGLEVDLRGLVLLGDVVAAVDVDVDAVDRVHGVGEAGEIDVDDVVDLEPGELLDHVERLLRATGRVGGVELVDADARDVHAQVAWDGEQRDPVLVRVDAQQHRRVRTARVALRVEALVRAHDQDRLRIAPLDLAELVLQALQRVVVVESRRDVGEVDEQADGRGGRDRRDDHDRPGGEPRPQAPCAWRLASRLGFVVWLGLGLSGRRGRRGHRRGPRPRRRLLRRPGSQAR